jgi:D-alanyl-D-alanine carboxypeptidase/D-alanyl-D-alanine-endopeptidase (penicillin-binding protein 4)
MRLLKRCQFLKRFAPPFFFFLILSAPVSAADSAKTPNTPKIKIEKILAASGLSRSRHSIQIVSLPEGKVLYEKNPDLALNSASNVKLVTAAAALRALGPDYTFKTEFYSDTLIDRDGKIRNLWIKGYGDPLFVTEELDSVVKHFLASGLRRIEGQVFVDDTYFDRYHLTTYLSDVGEKIYSIVTGPLSFNFNTIEIKARPGARLGDQPIIAIEPSTRYVTVQNRARTVGRGVKPLLEANLEETENNAITIHGSIPRTIREVSFRRGILDPATYTGTVILETLEKEGVEIPASLKREAVPRNALLILTHSSPPLREILKGLGKFSNNFIAEQLLKTLGAARLGPPGSSAKGLEVLRSYLDSLGIRRDSFVLDNGSGLSKLTRLSAAQLIRVLKDLYDSPWRQEVISSLSVAGVDGTMGTKMKNSRLTGKVFAKTGTLNGVTALSGYAADGRREVAFSFLFNDFSVSLEKVARVEEAILKTVLESL